MHCYASPLKTAGFLCLAAAMTATSYFVASHASSYVAWAGWVGLAFFGYSMLVIARQLITRTPLVSIDSRGITAARVGPEPIEWVRIDTVSIGKMHSTRFLCVWLKDEQGYVATLSTAQAALAHANHALGFPAVSIPFQGLSPGLDAAYAVARTYLPARSDV